MRQADRCAPGQCWVDSPRGEGAERAKSSSLGPGGQYGARGSSDGLGASRRRSEFAGPGSTPASFRPCRAERALLYSQNDNDAGVGIISQDFTDADFDIYDAEAADDFTVPGGSRWILTGITATGVYFNGFGPADYEKVVIYADAGGEPGAVVYARKWQAHDIAGSFTFPLPDVRLESGTYWVSVQPVMAFASAGNGVGRPAPSSRGTPPCGERGRWLRHGLHRLGQHGRLHRPLGRGARLHVRGLRSDQVTEKEQPKVGEAVAERRLPTLASTIPSAARRGATSPRRSRRPRACRR